MTMADLTIRPFDVHVPDEDLAELQRRIAATRWPSKELVEDRSQGVQLTTIQALVSYWGTGYDWRMCEARLNALPQFVTEIDGLDIHFIHVKSRHDGALPLIITHGWPGSVIEMLGVIGPLTDPTAHGGSAGDAFDLVLPSLPGYGLSDEPAETRLGPRPHRARLGGADAPPRLQPVRCPGRRPGRRGHRHDGRPGPDGLAGIHLNFLRQALGDVSACPADSDEERAAARRDQHLHGRAASATSWSRPRGRRRSATPCWTHRSRWRPGCSTTTPTATTRSPARLPTASPRAISPGTTSSTTSRCTG